MRTAVKTAALMSLGVPLATMPAIAQDDEGELAPVVITGSNIPTVELEGPSPVVTIDREEINRSSACLLYTSPSPRDATLSRMPSSA